MRSLYVLIDVTTSAAPILVASLEEIQLHGRIYVADHPGCKIIAPPLEGRGMAKIPADQLPYLIHHLGSAPQGDYAAQCQQALVLIQKLPINDTSALSLQKEIDRRGIGAPDANRLDRGEITDASQFLSKEAKQKILKPKKEKKEKKPDTSFEHPVRPKSNSTCGLVWDLLDALEKKLQRKPTSAEAREECAKENIKSGTASVQYSKWTKFTQDQ